MIRMNEMTWMEFKAKIDEGAITILPIGACEQPLARTVSTHSMAPICRCV